MPTVSYDVVKDFLGLSQSQNLPDGGVDAVMSNPSWILAVFRYQQAVTFSRLTMSSVSAGNDQAVAIVGGAPLIITSDCIQMQTEQNKGSFTGGLTAELIGGTTNYMSEILPGDWIAAWIFNNDADFTRVLAQIQNKQNANGFMDGFKFLGRVGSVREIVGVAGQTGMRTKVYQLQAESFKEFDATLFFDPYLSEQQPGIAQYISKMGKNLGDFLSSSGLGVDINKMMPFLLDLLLGTGAPPAITHAGGQASPNTKNRASAPPPQTAYGLTSGTGSAPYSYLVPAEVGILVGQAAHNTSSGILSAADLNDVLIGIQQYRGAGNGVVVSPGDNAPELIFQPDGLTTSGTRHITNKPLLGQFLPVIPEFTDKNVWTILQQYLNPAVNEMFTTLRVNVLGVVVPTLVIRQIPFSTSLLNQYLETNGIQMDLTYFLELPRWNIDPVLVMNANVGRSNSMRFNFIHTYGQSETTKISNPITTQIVKNPPVTDDLDAKRSGLASLQSTVNVLEKDIGDGSARKWMYLQADSHMGMHLVMSGTLNCYGIQAPISIGDNTTYDGVVYHIESVLHTCSMAPNGVRTFFTTLQLSHGLRAQDYDVTLQDDTAIFAGMYRNDMTSQDPGLTYDTLQPAVTTFRAPVANPNASLTLQQQEANSVNGNAA